MKTTLIRENKRLLVITSAIILLPVLAGLVLWNRLPDTMATHFGPDDAPNGFSSKPFAVFGIPLFVLACQWLSVIITENDPKRQNVNPKVFRIMLFICPAVSLLCGAITYGYALGLRPDIGRIGLAFMGLIFLVLGNYLPKCRQTYTIGIKLPWTLDDSDNWNRTHRLAGYLWSLCGLVLLLCAVFSVHASFLVPLLLILTVLIPVVYSFLLARKKGA